MTNLNAIKKTQAPVDVTHSQKRSALIVVPCFNEEQRLDPNAFLSFAQRHPDIGFVFVDDGSTDQTLAVLARMNLVSSDKIQVVSLNRNSGKAEAVRAGLEFACSQSVEMVGYWDADLATPLNSISDFANIMDRYADIEVVFGARKMMLGHRIHRDWNRKLISKVCSLLSGLVISLPISDTQCGAKLFRNSISLQKALEAPFSAGWLFDVELFARLTSQTKNPQNSFYEYPLSEWEEVAGSKVNGKAIVRAGLSVLDLIYRVRVKGSSLIEAVPSPAKFKIVDAPYPVIVGSETKQAA